MVIHIYCQTIEKKSRLFLFIEIHHVLNRTSNPRIVNSSTEVIAVMCDLCQEDSVSL